MNQPQKPLPSCDYPAAHSMDTTWFAVDRDGHVAAFESAEGGAVPEDALNDQQGEIDPISEISPHVTPCEIVYALEDQSSPLRESFQHVQPQKPYRPVHQPAQQLGLIRKLFAKLTGANAPQQDATSSPQTKAEEEQLFAPVIMFFADPQAAASAASDGAGRQVKSLRGNAVVFKKLPIELFRSIHDRKVCTGCYYLFELSDEDNFHPPQYSMSGLYHYMCCEDQMAVPYGRHTIPAQPLTIDQLPAELAEQLTKLQFADLSFSETPYIQPAERAKSFSWDGGYLREDFKTLQANPGQEEMYNETYEEIYNDLADDEYFKKFDIQPPTA